MKKDECGLILPEDASYGSVRNPREEREAEALREKEREAPGQQTSVTSGVQGIFQERELL